MHIHTGSVVKNFLKADDNYLELDRTIFLNESFSSGFAIVDGSLVKGLPEMLDDSKLAYGCLFKGDLIEDLARSAPYLVQLERNHTLTQRLFSSWKTHWGIIVMADCGIAEVIMHFRRMLIVRKPTGELGYFRWYDPRVALAYLKSLEGENLNEFLGPCKRVLVGDPDVPGCWEFLRQANLE